MPARRRDPVERARAGTLPRAPWFDIAHYAGIPDWTKQDWLRAIACRRLVQSNATPTARRHWDSIRTDCIGGGSRYSPEFLLNNRLGSPNSSFGPVAGVDDIEDEESIEPLRERLWEPSIRLLLVDLRASDDKLTASFRAWVRAQRDKGWNGKATRKAMTDDDVKNWTHSRVIPYIDIKLFEAAEGLTFRPVDICNALFGDGSGIEEMVRPPKKILEESTRRHARRLLSDRYFQQLIAEFGEYVPPGP